MLEFRVLGEFEVVRDGATLTLPPSRKTRALLAYLALTGHKHRRERLCEAARRLAGRSRRTPQSPVSMVASLAQSGEAQGKQMGRALSAVPVSVLRTSSDVARARYLVSVSPWQPT